MIALHPLRLLCSLLDMISINMTSGFEEIAGTAQDYLVPRINFAVADGANCFFWHRHTASFFFVDYCGLCLQLSDSHRVPNRSMNVQNTDVLQLLNACDL
jgi:hypothetical protein